MIYLYAVLDGRIRQLPRRGIRGAPIRLVRCTGCCAAVEDVRSVSPVTPRSLRVHDRVVRGLCQRANAVAPMRFGMVLGDERTLVDRVSQRAPEIGRLLDLIRGREQMTLRMFVGESGRHSGTSSDLGTGCRVPGAACGGRARSAPRTRHPEPSTRQAVGEGTRYLVSRATGMKQLEGTLEKIRTALRGLVCAEQLEPHGDRRLLTSVYHLIPRGDSASYLAIAGDLGAAARDIRIAISGPAPCYAFAHGVRI